MAIEWHAAHTKRRCEEQVYKLLLTKGIEVFLPEIVVVKERRGSKVTMVEPLFPGYLFTRVEFGSKPWDAARWTPGVKYILSSGDSPSPVPDEVIDFLKRRTGGTGRVMPGIPFEPGERVLVKEGPFKGLLAIFEKPISREGRVRILLEIMRRAVPVEVKVGDLAKVM